MRDSHYIWGCFYRGNGGISQYHIGILARKEFGMELIIETYGEMILDIMGALLVIGCCMAFFSANGLLVKLVQAVFHAIC